MWFLAATVIGVVAAPIVAVRQVRKGTLEIERSGSSSKEEALRFRIRHMLIAMVAVAVVMTLVKWLWPFLQNTSGDKWEVIAKLGTTLGVCSVVVIWATLGRDAFARTIVSALAAAGLAWLNFWVIQSSDGLLWLGMTLIVWAEVTILMWLIRAEGYRFVSEAGSTSLMRQDAAEVE
jgi:hypothetical protein